MRNDNTLENQEVRWHELFFKVMKTTGFLFIPALILSALATGQSETSYIMFALATVLYLTILVVARFEGYKDGLASRKN